MAERRHPAQVASDRLLEAAERWGHLFAGDEKDMIGRIRHRLGEIADQGTRQAQALRDGICPDCRTATLERIRHGSRHRRCTECGREFGGGW